MAGRIMLLIGFALLDQLNAGAQTCCSGGVPVSSNLGMPSSDVGAVQLSLSYDLNVLNTLKSGTEVLDDRNRSRMTHTALLEGGYTFSRKLSLDVLFSYVRQVRNVNNFGVEQITTTNGIGDGTVLIKYLLLDQKGLQVLTGVGVKAPIGPSDLTSKIGIALNADLQPGSGAWDGIGWVYFSKASEASPSRAFFGNLIYALKGHNKSYLGSQDYKFGNELQVIGGWGDRAFLFNQIFDVNLAARFRHAQPDENDFIEVPSTGGSWIFANPGLAWWPTPNLSLQANIELPILANITGTQVTPTVRFNTGVYYQIPNSKISLDL